MTEQVTKTHKNPTVVVRWPPVGQLPESLDVVEERIRREMSEQAAALGLDIEFGPGVVWNGTAAEAQELHAAIARECAASDNPCASDWINADCPTHATLDDQNGLDHLLMARRMASRLAAEEGI